MLLRTLFLVAFIVAIGDAVVFASAALGRATFHARENAAMRQAFATGIAQAQTSAPTATIPAPASTCAYAGVHGCTIAVSTMIATPTPNPQTTPAFCPSTSCVVYEQDNTHVTEGRIAYVITAQLRSANGDVLATRSATVAFRTFATAPYATLVGSLDATLDDAVGGVSDDGGSAKTGTLIHVRYQQEGSAATRSADVWKSVDERAATPAPAWGN